MNDKPCKNCWSIGGNVGCDVCGPPLRERKAQRKLLQKNTIADLLVTHDIIHAFAIEDPEGYDNYKTSYNVTRFTLALEALLLPEQTQ